MPLEVQRVKLGSAGAQAPLLSQCLLMWKSVLKKKESNSLTLGSVPGMLGSQEVEHSLSGPIGQTQAFL